MPKSGKHLLAAGDERNEPLVTYTRLSPEDSVPAVDGRVEPHFTAVRVDRRGRPLGARRGDEIDTLPLVDAPPSDVSLDPMAEVSAGEIRDVRPRRGPRVVALAGVLALVVGAGVLAAAYSGIASLDTGGAPVAAGQTAELQAVEPTVLAAADPPAVDATGRAVRVVSADQIPSPYSETAALAPSATADPVAGEAARPDHASVSGEAALLAEPPGRVIANPPPPRLRPITASFSPQQTVAPGFEPMATVGANPAWPAQNAPVAGNGADVESALASVDRILAEQHAAPAGDYYAGSGDGEFYGPAAPQPLPYPVLPPASTAYPGEPTYYPGGEPYGPYYPGQEPYAAQPIYPGGLDMAAEQPAQSPWWLPKRRALVIPNAPVPPASVPNAPGW